MTTSSLLMMEYQRLGKSGLKVSKIILGCMSYGSSSWAKWVLDEEASLDLLKAAYDKGITTWDTAEIYSNGQSEVLIGKAIRKFSIPRERLVIMTKVFGAVDEENVENRVELPVESENEGQWVNRWGLSRKHILDSVDDSVRRLGTYIDVLQIHHTDPEVECEEIMKALHDVVSMGHVRYIGASSMYAWQFSQLQFTATINNWTKFISMQNFYNLLYREEEREMMPFCKHTGVGLMAWSPVGRGLLARPYEKRTDSLRSKNDARITSFFLQHENTAEGERDRETCKQVEIVAESKSVSMASVALAWVLARGSFPVVGMSSVERMDDAIAALGIELNEEEQNFLEECYHPKRVKAHT
ncbi:Aldo/keto reductase [Cadophora sp. MPI-SDFR-AT-0126]|nr:Aldo/keto reductase [Leotiomycetes sp. MPI-SDFR-AT-0126]